MPVPALGNPRVSPLRSRDRGQRGQPGGWVSPLGGATEWIEPWGNLPQGSVQSERTLVQTQRAVRGGPGPRGRSARVTEPRALSGSGGGRRRGPAWPQRPRLTTATAIAATRCVLPCPTTTITRRARDGAPRHGRKWPVAPLEARRQRVSLDAQRQQRRLGLAGGAGSASAPAMAARPPPPRRATSKQVATGRAANTVPGRTVAAVGGGAESVSPLP